ncbi:hypothetical protein scyTo_0011136 [Scyliorhinus torazame]|uniref:Uncharacterized protein n=1 Tax=Scyliorhinus torazame TaxID=75743 RepID=A0A401NHT8_SCYTO|nr:hypothetical protein [Scyliorhinus torazame]
MFNDNDKQSDEFHRFRMTGENRMILDLLTYAKGTPSDAIDKLEEVNIEEVLNMDNEAPVVYSTADGEIAEMVLNQGDCDGNSEDEDNIINTAEKVPFDVMVKMCDGFIEGLE